MKTKPAVQNSVWLVIPRQCLLKYLLLIIFQKGIVYFPFLTTLQLFLDSIPPTNVMGPDSLQKSDMLKCEQILL